MLIRLGIFCFVKSVYDKVVGLCCMSNVYCYNELNFLFIIYIIFSCIVLDIEF